MKQSQALSILKTGVNVFLTGEPGSGKTHTVNEYISYLKTQNIEPAITASTGIASTHIGGMTIHSWSGIGIKTNLTKEDISRIKSNSKVASRIRRAKVLIIDEISMLSPTTLQMVEYVCRAIKGSSEVFGGIQVVLVGDFFQLPPVVKADPAQPTENTLIKEPVKRFAYDSPIWDKANFITCYLTEQYRQDDANFIQVLSSIRRNEFDQIIHIEKRKIVEHMAPKNAPKLFSHNIDVDRVNNQKLSEITVEMREFEMITQGNERIVDSLIKGCLSPQNLQLKIGAAVMFTKNNRMAGFANGTLGIVEGFNKESGLPIVKTRSGRKIEVEPMDWIIEDGSKILGRITQLPLRLAWAITVHKSQGMSLDEAFMDLSGVFEFGQGYVALSRIRRLTGLYISGWNKRAFQVHPEVLTKDKFFRDDSMKAEHKYRDKHINLKSDLSGNNVIKINKPGSGFDEIRKLHANAYKPWSDAEDKELQRLYLAKLPIAEIAKILGRKRGSITSRLKKVNQRSQ